MMNETTGYERCKLRLIDVSSRWKRGDYKFMMRVDNKLAGNHDSRLSLS
jgi:hypothetical protein